MIPMPSALKNLEIPRILRITAPRTVAPQTLEGQEFLLGSCMSPDEPHCLVRADFKKPGDEVNIRLNKRSKIVTIKKSNHWSMAIEVRFDGMEYPLNTSILSKFSVGAYFPSSIARQVDSGPDLVRIELSSSSEGRNSRKQCAVYGVQSWLKSVPAALRTPSRESRSGTPGEVENPAQHDDTSLPQAFFF